MFFLFYRFSILISITQLDSQSLLLGDVPNENQSNINSPLASASWVLAIWLFFQVAFNWIRPIQSYRYLIKPRFMHQWPIYVSHTFLSNFKSSNQVRFYDSSSIDGPIGETFSWWPSMTEIYRLLLTCVTNYWTIFWIWDSSFGHFIHTSLRVYFGNAYAKNRAIS